MYFNHLNPAWLVPFPLTKVKLNVTKNVQMDMNATVLSNEKLKSVLP